MTSPILRGPSRRKRCQNPIQQRWASENKPPRKPLQNHRYADLCAKLPKEMASGMHIKDKKNGQQVNFSFSKIWWASKVSLLAIENDCVARSYRFSVPLTCTRAIIRQKVYSPPPDKGKRSNPPWSPGGGGGVPRGMQLIGALQGANPKSLVPQAI